MAVWSGTTCSTTRSSERAGSASTEVASAVAAAGRTSPGLPRTGAESISREAGGSNDGASHTASDPIGFLIGILGCICVLASPAGALLKELFCGKGANVEEGQVAKVICSGGLSLQTGLIALYYQHCVTQVCGAYFGSSVTGSCSCHRHIICLLR